MTTSSTDIHQRILDGATTLFVHHGYHGISMREIAERAGVSKPALYYHFRDKEDLFLAILTANIERIERIVLAAQREETTARRQIGRILREIMANAPEQHAIIRLATQELAHLGPNAQTAFGQLYHEKFTRLIETILAEGMARGELRGLNAHQVAWILLGMMYPFIYPSHDAGLDTAGDASEMILEVFFDGLAAPPAADQPG